MCVINRGKFPSMLSLPMQIILATAQRKKGVDTKFKLKRGIQYTEINSLRPLIG